MKIVDLEKIQIFILRKDLNKVIMGNIHWPWSNEGHLECATLAHVRVQ